MQNSLLIISDITDMTLSTDKINLITRPPNIKKYLMLSMLLQNKLNSLDMKSVCTECPGRWFYTLTSASAAKTKHPKSHLKG